MTPNGAPQPTATESGADPARRVGFLIAGVQKGGTTSLYGMLAQHRQIARADTKELHFFDREKRNWANPDYADYHRRILWHEGATIAGESTPSYVFWPGAMERIHAYNPDMRLLVSFRDPVERAFSQWCMERDRRAGTPDFGEAIRAVAPDSWPRTTAEAGRPHRAFVARGYYGQQLARVLELFPREQVLVLDYHRLFADVQRSLDQITDFIGVDRFAEPPPMLHDRARPATLDASPPAAEDVTFLVERFREDLESFATVAGIDVSGWPTAQVAGGARTAADVAEALGSKVTYTTDPPADAQRRRERRASKVKQRRKARKVGSEPGEVSAVASSPDAEAAGRPSRG